MNNLFSVGTRAAHGPEPAYWQEFQMHLTKKLSDNGPVNIIMRRETHERLRKTCFRGVHIMKAGNFREWSSAVEMFHDYGVMDLFLEELNKLFESNEFGGMSVGVTLFLPDLIGWESTAPLEQYPEEALEKFQLNRRSSGLRVKSDRTDLPAPLTNLVTIVFEFKLEDGMPTAIVHSIYPGVDVGNLSGDVTDRECRVFFDWDHPGER